MSSVKTIHYSSARCGAGKTYWAIGQMAERKMRTVLAVDRREVAEERAEAIRLRANGSALRPSILIVHSDEDRSQNPGSVADRIAKAHAELAPLSHAVLIITHAALRLADLSCFQGWTLIIDEAPKLLEHVVHDTGAMLGWLELNYELGQSAAAKDDAFVRSTPITQAADGSYGVQYKGAFSVTDIAKKGSREWMDFHAMVLTGEAACDIGDWREKDRWSAWRLLRPSVLFQAFVDVFILADSFTETEACLLMAADADIDLQEIPAIKAADTSRVWKPRDVLIQYYLEDRSVSDSLLKSPAFRPQLKAIGRHIAENTVADDHLWSCNDDEAKLLKACGIPGAKVQPIQAGANQFDQIASVSMLYSAKPSPEASALFRRWGISTTQLVAVREFNAIRQFVMRSNARVPESTKALTVRVYDKAQAEDLEHYLTQGYGFKLKLEHIVLGLEIGKPARSAQGRAAPMTMDEKRARQATYTRKWRERAAANGSVM